MKVTWYLCDLKTGAVVTELPIATAGDIESTISTATTVSVAVQIHAKGCPTNWADLIDPMRAMLVPAFGDDEQVAVGFYIDSVVTGKPTADLTLRSLEGIPDEVNVRTHDFFEDEDDEAHVAAMLLADVVAPSFGFDVIFTETGKTGDHSYAFEEDRTVKSALDDLAQADGGPEWTVQLRWENEKHQRIIKWFEIGPRVGAVTPATVFENKHLAEDRIRRRAFGSGQRATYVIATSDGSGLDRPMSTPHVDTAALAAGVPQWETRVAFSGVDDDAQLDALAVPALARRRRGVTTFELSLRVDESGCPVLGRDFRAGDTVTIDSGPTANDPVSWQGLARVIGWRAEVSGSRVVKVTPIFWTDPHEEGAA